MNYIKLVHIEGFKKFNSIDVPLNPHMNILVGENEAGKSTILEAIRIVINQQYRNADKSVLSDLFNVENVAAFKANPSVQTLPRIVIELFLELDAYKKNAPYFHGEVYGGKGQKDEKYGIRFECKFDAELGSGLEGFISEGNLPLEYYSLTWTTFANNPYRVVKRPLNFLFVDTSVNASGPSFSYYSKSLFSSKYDNETQARAKNEFRAKLDDAFDSVALDPIDEKRKFGIDGKKVQLENVISIFEDSIPLENRGSGMESLIKTQIAFDKANALDVVLMEEPENHLCFTTMRKMLHEISGNGNSSQVIITTHSNMIACTLNLNNVLWVAEGRTQSLGDVPEDVAEFFTKADNNAFLQLLLSKKAILVEGATEFILLPKLYEQLTKRTIEADEVTIIPCGGVSYKKYLAIAERTNKKVAVITDNDRDFDRIVKANEYNDSHGYQHVFMDQAIEGWTWEVCFYRENKEALDGLIKVAPNAKYLFHEKDYGPVLGKMLNNKADIAYQMLMAGIEFAIPQDVKEAIEWLNE
jgi:putative ATP-dependent endonuclease of OLD family